ncbi:hypothetical protein [Longibaculum muris]|uniref:hypothetical protein n=1 Tax=Longibaculum muris TaxID=1796628 RepID=UPI0022E902B7|nr:hypothetical protein [Longibaculum muris]
MNLYTRIEKYNAILNDLGFTDAEIELYIRLSHLGTSTKEKRIQIVNEKRRKILEEIHVKENQLQEIDFLRHELKNE